MHGSARMHGVMDVGGHVAVNACMLVLACYANMEVEHSHSCGVGL